MYIKYGRKTFAVLRSGGFLKQGDGSDGVCDAALIAPDTQGVPDMNTDCLYALTFYDAVGIPNELKVYEDGYVMYMPFGETDLRYMVIVKVAL